MKKYILSMGMIMAVFAFIAMLPLKASAAVSAINATESEEGKASVKLTLPNAAQEGITTVSISLSLDLRWDRAGSRVYGVDLREYQGSYVPVRPGTDLEYLYCGNNAVIYGR